MMTLMSIPPRRHQQRRRRSLLLSSLLLGVWCFVSRRQNAWNDFSNFSTNIWIESDDYLNAATRKNTSNSNSNTILLEEQPSLKSPPSSFSLTLKDDPRTVIHVSNNQSQIQVYTRIRSDRTGAALWDYFNAHAFGFRHFQQNVVWMGACGMARQEEEPYQTFQREHRQALQTLGLDHEIPLLPECPSRRSTSEAEWTVVRQDGKVVRRGGGALTANRHSSPPPTPPQLFLFAPTRTYLEWNGTHTGYDAVFTPSWITYMRAKLAPDYQQRGLYGMQPSSTTTIVVHIRRGDVHPCNAQTRGRYLTNQYYVDAIQSSIMKHRAAAGRAHNNDEYTIILHSESQSFETWHDLDQMADEFRNKNRWNVTLKYKLDAGLKVFWGDVLQRADIFVMSKSALSQVAAILMDPTNTRVLCTPFVDCHSNWDRVSHQTLRHEEDRLHSLARSRCHESLL